MAKCLLGIVATGKVPGHCLSLYRRAPSHTKLQLDHSLQDVHAASTIGRNKELIIFILTALIYIHFFI